MSRPRKYAETAAAKRQVLDLPDDDEQCDWVDTQEDDEGEQQ